MDFVEENITLAIKKLNHDDVTLARAVLDNDYFIAYVGIDGQKNIIVDTTNNLILDYDCFIDNIDKIYSKFSAIDKWFRC